jgi:hypothetical protein
MLCWTLPGGWAQPSRFSRNTSVTDQPVVKDNVTGPFWQGCAARLTGNACIAGAAATYAWADALRYCAGLNWGGRQDWRLPNAKELRSTVNERRTPAFDLTAFPNAPESLLWSSSSDAGFASAAWCVYFSNGYMFNMGKVGNYGFVRCVRSGP